MKNVLIILTLLLSMVMVSSVAEAQIVRFDQLVTTAKHLDNSAGDSTSNLEIVWNPAKHNGIHPELEGLLPDSVWILYSLTDSVSTRFYFRSAGYNGTYAGDSLGAATTTTAGTTGRIVVPLGLYITQQTARVVTLAKASANGVLSTHKQWVAYVRFFKKPS